MIKVAIVGGAGHVGLPLGLALAGSGLMVTAIDIDENKVKQINEATMPFKEEGAENLLRSVIESGHFRASTEKSEIGEADFIVLVLGTPVDEHGNPDAINLEVSISPYMPFLKQGQHVLLRSTVFPGVFKLLERKLELIDETISLSYCPERISQGNALNELHRLPQIIGARSKEVFGKASSLFSILGCETIWISPEEAELAKLFTNTWRYLKFAIANEFWTISNSLNLDYENIRKALIYDYPRANDLPKAGFAAGPCLLKDTMQLDMSFHGKFQLGHAAISVNEGLPHLIVEIMMKNYQLDQMRVGLLGAAFKPNSDDIRSSLSFKLRKLLRLHAKQVLISDPYVQNDSRIVPLNYLLQNSDVLIICTPHSVYLNMNFDLPLINVFESKSQSKIILNQVQYEEKQ